ncbi:MAG: DeoR/GlpR family DNA-binding transcription regulator [Propionibacteriaceae bacterium]|nr:DeoR/GlpR family DNA-binding transcription regulator [Propionibacteriaceae bacterium]
MTVTVERAERASFILDRLAAAGEVSVSGLAEELGLSEVTVRSTLQGLEDEGLLIRTRGGAKPTAFKNIRLRQADRVGEKERIAAAAAAMVDDYDRVMIEAGTTCAIIPRMLMGKRRVQVVTNSTLVFANARLNPSLNIILTGGVFRPESESLVGPVAERSINDFNARIAFLGTDGFSVERGLTTQLVEGGQVATLMRQRAEQTWLVADSSKFGRAGFVSFLKLSEVTGIITDSGIPAAAVDELQEHAEVRVV